MPRVPLQVFCGVSRELLAEGDVNDDSTVEQLISAGVVHLLLNTLVEPVEPVLWCASFHANASCLTFFIFPPGYEPVTVV